jgi:hypothetical protein
MSLFCSLILLLLSSAAARQDYTDGATKHNYTEKELIRYTRAVDVQKLDPSLSSDRLDHWLRSGPAHIDELRWQVIRDCDLKERPHDVAEGDWPLCVRFVYRRGTLSGWGMTRIGTRNKGISGPPTFEYFTVITERPFTQGPAKLSELPRTLDELSSSTHR